MSKPRGAMYAFSVAVLALYAYKTKMAQEEVALWQTVLVFGYLAAAGVLATVKTWPRKGKMEEHKPDA